MPLEDTHLTLNDRLILKAAGPSRWRSLHGDVNQNGRSFGGQLLGQAMRAALMDIPEGRVPTMMQFLFLQGAMPNLPIVFEVNRLQEGKRFSSRHVRGVQDERTVLDAQVSCAMQLAGPTHAEPSPIPSGERPDELPCFDEAPEHLRERLVLMGGYGLDRNSALDFRIPDPGLYLDEGGTHTNRAFRYWMKASQALPEDSAVHASAFAYLSDWWLNFCILRPHLAQAGDRGMYISSLNHALWFHDKPQADCWLHVSASSVHAGMGRGLAIAQYHNEAGRHIATATQDCLVAYTN